VTLSGDELFRAPAVAAAHINADSVLLGEDRLIELRDVPGGEVLDRITDVPVPAPQPWIAARGDQLLLRAEGGLQPVVVGAAGLEREEPVALPFEGPVLQAVGTPRGIVAQALVDPGDGPSVAALASDRSPQPAAFPAVLSVLDLRASADGHVGVVAEVDGARALLIYGRDADE
jgi:hypothetical protein